MIVKVGKYKASRKLSGYGDLYEQDRVPALELFLYIDIEPLSSFSKKCDSILLALGAMVNLFITNVYVYIYLLWSLDTQMCSLDLFFLPFGKKPKISHTAFWKKPKKPVPSVTSPSTGIMPCHDKTILLVQKLCRCAHKFGCGVC